MRGVRVRPVEAGGWVVASALLLFCALRGWDPAGTTLEEALLAALPGLLLPSVPLLALAIYRRRWLMAGAAVVALVAGLIWEGPVM